jgi:hypothetical protein
VAQPEVLEGQPGAFEAQPGDLEAEPIALDSTMNIGGSTLMNGCLP